MTRWWYTRLFLCVSVAFGLLAWSAGQVTAAEKKDMKLVGHDDLQARSAYQPIIHQQGGQFIAYVGHHSGSAFNPLTGMVEQNGVSIVDVTDPRNPVYLHHIPPTQGDPRQVPVSGAQMVQACNFGGQTFLLRTNGNVSHEIWDVTDPSNPAMVTTVVVVGNATTGRFGTHKNWWECDTGIAYLVSSVDSWRERRVMQVFDLSNPTSPVHIRDFSLVGVEPGSTGPVPGGSGLHETVALGDRLYLAYGTGSNGVLQILDRDKLLTGDPDPTPENLLFPEIGRIDMPPFWGGHTAFPLIGVEIADFADNRDNTIRDFVVLVSESVANECQETRHAVFFVDITDPTKPFPVSNFQVPESSGDFCERGGRFGPHSAPWSFTDVFYKRVLALPYFNAGIRAVDIRDPFHPKQVAFFIPETTANTAPRGDKIAIQTNNVEVDERGLIYSADRADTGLHILELKGKARKLLNLP